MSRNTGHYWYLYNPEYPEKGTVVIFHKHRASHPYHYHGQAHTLRQAVRSIRVHDKYQLTLRGINNRILKCSIGGSVEIKALPSLLCFEQP